ncbi:MAG: prepilin-type N-terminal cleavage/methylation domain-containing protein [Pseudoxanthomonas sp.]
MRWAVRSRRSAQSGFTLLEVIVAFALLALALGLLLGAMSGATRQVRDAEDAGRAALHAQSLLAQAGVGAALRPGATEGEWEGGRYRWRLQVSPYVDPARPSPPVASPGVPRLLQLQLDVRWGEAAGQSLQVRSLRRVAGGEAAL